MDRPPPDSELSSSDIMVKSNRPLTPETGVRFPVGSPILKYLA